MIREILIDQDNTVSDFEQGFLTTWRSKFPQHPYIELTDRTTFFIRDQYPQNLRSDVESIYTTPGFMSNLPPIPGAIQALREIAEKGISVKIVSTPLKQHSEEKYEWIENHLGLEWTGQLILTRDKTQILGDLLIDDYPDLTGASTPTWEHVIFDRPYNRHITNKRRLVHWSNWRELLTTQPTNPTKIIV